MDWKFKFTTFEYTDDGDDDVDDEEAQDEVDDDDESLESVWCSASFTRHACSNGEPVQTQ